MAARKKRVLSAEEQLEAALVPESEWPYEVPDNWCWVKGGGLFKPMQSIAPVGETFRYIDIESIDNHRQEVNEPKEMPVEKAPSRARRKLSTGDTVFSMVRPYLKNIAYIDEDLDGCIASTGFYVCSPAECLDGRYLYYLMCSGYVVDGLNAFMKGDNSPSIRSRDVELFPFPLPPLHEQRRIASRIEWLFAKLNDAEAELREVIDSSEQRQAAILHRAFTGQLTEAWRKEHGISRKTWAKKTLGEVCSSIFDGDHMPPPKVSKGIPFLVISNVNNGHLSFEDTRFVPEAYYNNLTATRKPRIGDVLYTLVGSYGIPVMVDDERPFCFQRHMALLKPSDIEQRFLWYLLRSQSMFEKATAIATGTAQLTVPIKGLRNLEFDCPGSEERDEIIRQLDILLSKEEQTLSTVRSVLEITTLTRQAILAKALRGELGTNDPAEPNSKELLTSVASKNAGK